MKNKYAKRIVCSLLLLGVMACTTKESFYYDDPQTPGVAIFSDKSNNVMSCIINGQPWQTFTRTSGGWSSSGDEVYIRKQFLDSLTSLLSITWQGSSASGGGEISLNLVVSKDFGYRDFNKLQGQRMTIDGNTNYFLANIGFTPKKGAGYIYFNTAHLDSSNYGVSGKMSGLLSGDFNTYQLSSGRFDHSLFDVFVN